MQQDDTWTHVPSKRNRNPTAAALQSINANPPSKDVTLTKLTSEFTAKLKTWQQSTCRKTLLQLTARIQPEAGWHLRRAICLGSGSLSRENLECRRRSFWQMVVFYDLARNLLGSEGGSIYAQEPAFTALDRDFLASLGIKTSDAELPGDGGLGAAKQHLGPDSFIFEPFIDMNAVMLQEILHAGVGLYVGSSIRGILERIGESEVGSLAKRFQDGREMLKFPSFDVDPNILDGIWIYWKEEAAEEEDE